MIELYGYCSAASRKDDTNRFTYPRKQMNSFKSYMSDSVHIAGDPPPISLSRNCFNFGQADVDMEKVSERISHAICLTNHSQLNLVVSWEKGDFIQSRQTNLGTNLLANLNVWRSFALQISMGFLT